MTTKRPPQVVADAEAGKRALVNGQMAQFERGYRKPVGLGVYLGVFGIIAAVIGLIVGLVASYWWILWCGAGAFVVGAAGVLVGLTAFSRNANSALLGMWTPIQHVEDAGAVQIKLMDDGFFVVLSVGVTHLLIYVTPKMGDLARITQVTSFGLRNAEARVAMSRDERRAEDEQLLDQVRQTVGFPKSVNDVQVAAEKLSQSIG